MKCKVLVLVLIFLANIVVSEAVDEVFSLSNWKAHSAFSDVNSLAIDGKSRLWCGSNGGISVVDINSPASEPTYLSTESGMSSLEVTALAYSPNHKLIIAGTYDGTLQIFSEDFACEPNSDIKRAGFTNTVITDIIVNGDYAYISGGFGIAVYDIGRKIFTETVTKIANFNRFAKINKLMISQGKIYAAGEEGIAIANLNSLIQNPSNWTSIPANIKGIKSNYKSSHLVAVRDTVYAVSDFYILKLQADTFKLITEYPNYSLISSLLNINDSLYISDQFGIGKINEDRLPISHPLYDIKNTNIVAAKVISDGDVVKIAFAYKENGVGISENNSITLPKFNSPLKRSFKDLTFDNHGNLWLATGKAFAGRGFSILTADNKWINQTFSNNPLLKTNEFFNVYAAPDGKIYYGTWGAGLFQIEFDADKLTLQNYDSKNSPLTGVKGDPNNNYVLAAGVKADAQGNLWIINVNAVDGKPLLIKLKPDNTFDSITMPSGINIQSMMSLDIDGNNTKWVASIDNGGLLYANESKSKYGRITTTGTNLLSNSINSIAFDKGGVLWIGTNDGLNVMPNSSAVLGTTMPTIRKINALLGKMVNKVYVDAINNKWIATNEGIFVISADGSQVIAEFNKKNSPLTSDIVNSITSNPVTGTMYFATESNLYSARSLSVTPEQDYSITCYPQPFYPLQDEVLTINGLVQDNILKIVTMEGRFVRSINAAGGRAVWDGRDEKGETVETGVYLISASSSAGSQTSVGKIAVKIK